MSRSVKIFYGMSGAFKETTIKSRLRDELGSDVMWSGIKQWKYWEELIKRKNGPHHLNLALLHLSRLKDKEYNIAKDNTTLFVERGVSDMLFYWLHNLPAISENETIIKNLIEEEISVSKIAAGGEEKPWKVLLIQRDYDFVQNIVLKELTRSECFPGGIKDYINAQDRYISFTKKYNDINEIIEIDNAKEYLKKLGIKWDAKESN